MLCHLCATETEELSLCPKCGLFNGFANSSTVDNDKGKEASTDQVEHWERLAAGDIEEAQPWILVKNKKMSLSSPLQLRTRQKEELSNDDVVLMEDSDTEEVVLPSLEVLSDDKDHSSGEEQQGVVLDVHIADLEVTTECISLLCNVSKKKVSTYILQTHQKALNVVSMLLSDNFDRKTRDIAVISAVLIAAFIVPEKQPAWLAPDAGMLLDSTFDAHIISSLVMSLTAATSSIRLKYINSYMSWLVRSVECELLCQTLEARLGDAVVAQMDSCNITVYTICYDAVGLCNLEADGTLVEMSRMCIWGPVVQLVICRHAAARRRAEKMLGKMVLLDLLDAKKHGKEHGRMIAHQAIRRLGNMSEHAVHTLCKYDLKELQVCIAHMSTLVARLQVSDVKNK